MARPPKRTMLVVEDPSGDFRAGKACFSSSAFAGTMHDKWWPVGMIVEQLETGVRYRVTNFKLIYPHSARNARQHRLIPLEKWAGTNRALVPWNGGNGDMFFLRELRARLG